MPLDLFKERDGLLRYVQALPIHKELRSNYCNQIRIAFVNLQSGGNRGIRQLKTLEGKIPFGERGPISDFLERLKENQSKGKSKAKRKVGRKQTDLAVICALKDPELNRILDLLESPSEIKTNELGAIESHTYYLGNFRSSHATDGQTLTLNVVAAHQVQKGIADCAILAAKVIQRWRPRYLVMTGVCGGRKSSGIRLGDIIVPTEIFTYQTGEFTERGFRVEPKVVNMNHGLTQRIQACASWIPYEIVKSWPGARHDPPQVWTQPLACGDAIINRKDMLDKEVATLNRKVVGVDMESYAVLRATRLLGEYHTLPLVIKSVMDFTEKRRSSSDKAFAAFASAQFLYHFALAEMGG